MQKDEFVLKLKENAIEINEKQLSQFALYYELLKDQNQKTNLTTIIKEEEVYSKHFYDSLLMMFDCEIKGELADIGSGAGFPGIPLKIMNPDLALTLIDPTKKKINFLHMVVRELGLKNVILINQRAEEHCKDKREHYDLVVSRAVANLNILSELCLPLAKVNGEFWALKGPNVKEELSAGKKAIKKLGGQLTAIHKHGYDDQSRNNLQISKIKPSPIIYPRNYGQIKKQALC